jgi:hypothetical protein
MNPAQTELLMMIIVFPALVVGFFALLFGLARLLPSERVQRMGRGLRRLQFRLWHLVITVLVTGLVLNALNGPPQAVVSIILLSLLMLAWFVRTWCNQFVFLMGLRDEDLPGRHDKLIWVFVLFVFPPISVWFFRSYRQAHWPAPEAVTPSPLHTGAAGERATQPV